MKINKYDCFKIIIVHVLGNTYLLFIISIIINYTKENGHYYGTSAFFVFSL